MNNNRGSLVDPNTNASTSTSKSTKEASAPPPGGRAFSNQTITVQSSTNAAYSTALKQKHNTPKEDQAILINTIREVRYVDYVQALSKLVDSKNITHASNISHNRMCIYFTSKEVAENFIIDHGGINVDGLFFAARRLSTPAKRITISNVSADIPFIAIENKLKSLNFKLVSPITSISAGIKIPGLEHIQSFRAQVYMVLEDNEYLPDTLLLDYDGKQRRIYFSRGEFKCFRCGQVGHAAASCQEIVEEPTQPEKRPVIQNQINETPEDESVERINSSETHIVNIEMPPPLITMEKGLSQNKTPAPTKEVSQGENMETDGFETQRKRKTRRTSKSSLSGSCSSLLGDDENKKKSRKEIPDPPDALDRTKDLFKEELYPPMTFEEMHSFLKEVKGHENPLPILQEYTEAPKEVIALLKDMVKEIEYQALKERVKRLIRKLEKTIANK